MDQDSTQVLAERLAIYLSAYKHYLDIKSKARLLDITVFGEALSKDIAKIVFDCQELVNLNLSHPNHPAIDLGDSAKKLAIQVTISGTSQKIAETLALFYRHELDKTYSRLIFIILGCKQKAYESKEIVCTKDAFTFDPKKDIYDLADLYNTLVSIGSADKFAAFNTRMEKELGSRIRPYLFEYDRPGQRLRALFESHEVTTTYAVEALKAYGVSPKAYSDSASLSEMASPALIDDVAAQFAISPGWLAGDRDHIYSEKPGSEASTFWRRNLRDAFETVQSLFADGERITLIVPSEASLSSMSQALMPEQDDYEHFYLVSRKRNAFAVDRCRLVLSDILSYQSCREGIFRLLLAVALLNLLTEKHHYLEIVTVDKTALLSCLAGNRFAVELLQDGVLSGNHTSYFDTLSTHVRAMPTVPEAVLTAIEKELRDYPWRLNWAGQRLCCTTARDAGSEGATSLRFSFTRLEDDIK